MPLAVSSLCAVLSSVQNSRSVVKLHWCPQNRFKSCPFVGPSGKVLRVCVFQCHPLWCCAPYPGISHRLRLVNSAENKFVSAHSEQCESVSLVHLEESVNTHPRGLPLRGFLSHHGTKTTWWRSHGSTVAQPTATVLTATATVTLSLRACLFLCYTPITSPSAADSFYFLKLLGTG